MTRLLRMSKSRRLFWYLRKSDWSRLNTPATSACFARIPIKDHLSNYSCEWSKEVINNFLGVGGCFFIHTFFGLDTAKNLSGCKFLTFFSIFCKQKPRAFPKSLRGRGSMTSPDYRGLHSWLTSLCLLSSENSLLETQTSPWKVKRVIKTIAESDVKSCQSRCSLVLFHIFPWKWSGRNFWRNSDQNSSHSHRFALY